MDAGWWRLLLLTGGAGRMLASWAWAARFAWGASESPEREASCLNHADSSLIREARISKLAPWPYL